MVLNYQQQKTNRAKWSKENMERALNYPWNGQQSHTKIPRSTVKRHTNNHVFKPGDARLKLS